MIFTLDSRLRFSLSRRRAENCPCHAFLGGGLNMVRDRRNRRIGDIQRDLRPDQGGEVLSEFMLEFVWPLATFVVLMALLILVVYL